MPDLHLITTMFDSQRYEIIKEKIMDSKYGFSFDVLFSLKSNKIEFNYNDEVKTILRYISGSNKEIDFKNGDKSIFTRINKISSRIPFTQIWFLPSDNINEISNCLMKLMKEDGILKHYDVLCINRKNKELAKDVKDEINKQETIAREKGKKGLILLAGNMLSLGITINSCDIVMLMNNTLSSDKVMQQMYRCMTEGENKKYGFVIDLNISRVLNTCVNYTIYKNSNSIEDKINYLIENHLINIDNDIMENKKVNSDIIVKKLMEIWKGDPINSFKSLLRNLDNDYIEFDTDTQKLINKLFTSSLNNDKINATINIKDEDDEIQEFPSGKEIKENKSEKLNSSESDESDNEGEINTSFTKDVLHTLIPLICLLTMQNKNKDFIKMLNDIKEDKQLLEVFDEQCLIWWNKKDLINIIKEIVSKYFDKNSNTYNISIQFKMSIQSLIDRPKELLELINECLKPKVVEKHTFGEVFTPMDFINDKQLKDLETYWKKKYNENIWTNEKLTYYDPATGMGNYPIAIYYKLMDGLKDKIPDEKERKKHIIEKMLYIGELIKKNCFVVKQIFNLNNEYKLNLYEGNTLEIDIKKVFNKSKFDIIHGNPPYNEKLTNSGAKPLYNKFIEYYINKCDYLTFIVPSRWFSGGKGLDKFREMMLKRKDIVHIIHYDDACKIFGNSVDIKGGVNYFLIDKNYDGLCNYNGSNIQLNKYDIMVDSKYYDIIEKLSIHKKITDLYLGRYYGIESNDKRLKDDDKQIKCYVSQQKGFIKYIDKKEIKKDYNFYKVITTEAAYEGNSGFGNTFIGNINEVHTGSYISFKVSTEKEAKSLVSYMKCKLPNFMLSLRKISQHINEIVCKWIPLPTLDKEWTDDEVYKYFKLTSEEIKLVKETKVSGYKDISKKEEIISNKNETNDNKVKKDYQKVKYKRKNYYLDDDKVYIINKDKSKGELFGNYIEDKVIELLDETDEEEKNQNIIKN
jgi:site-specific DNA-methyltransferase (adenine-specific)